MNSLQWYLIGVVLVITAVVCGYLWWASGTEKATALIVTSAPVHKEPTYKISEEYGRHRIRTISTEYGESCDYSEHPGVYYQLWRWDKHDKEWFRADQTVTLAEAEQILMGVVNHDAERNKVRPTWEYRKDGSPYLGD